MSGVQCVGGLFSFSLSLKANLTGVHASFLFYCSALQASAQSQVLHLTQAHSFKFTFTVSLANDRELMSCDFLMLGCQWWVLLLLLDQILLWAFWVCSSWNRKPTSLEGGKRPWKGKIRQKMLHALRDLKMHLFFLFFYIHRYISISIDRDISLYLLSISSPWWFLLFTVGLRKTFSMHYSPILEMLLYHEYFLWGTEEKCFCAVVYDKLFLLHSTVADTPIMKIQWIGKLEEGRDRNLTAATMK